MNSYLQPESTSGNSNAVLAAMNSNMKFFHASDGCICAPSIQTNTKICLTDRSGDDGLGYLSFEETGVSNKCSTSWWFNQCKLKHLVSIVNYLYIKSTIIFDVNIL